MRPLNLRLRGFKGIRKGMGLDEITLDLSQISGLVALAGENGRGKSTVLENLHPYRSLFSRSGSLNAHTFLRDSEKEFTFEYEGHIYRTLLKIDAESDRGEGFIWKDGEPQVNGKRKEYDAYIENLLGSQFLFQNSVFCAQNSKKLTDLRTGELREMFAEFLRLDRLQGYEATCKQVIGILGGMAQQIENRIGGMRERTAAGPFIASKEGSARSALAVLFVNLEQIKKDITERQQTIESFKEKVSQNALHFQRKSDIETAIKTLTSERAELTVQEEVELRDLRAKYAAVKAEHDAAVAILKDRGAIEGAAARVREIEEGLAGLVASIEEMGADLPVFQKKCHDQETVIAGLRQQVKDLDPMTDQENVRLGKLVDEAERTVKEKEKEIRELDDSRELFTLNAQIKNTEAMTTALDAKDPACVSTTCSFIVGALRAAEILPDLKTKKSNLMCTIAINRHVIEEAIEKIKKDTADVLTDKAARLAQIAESRKTIGEFDAKATNDLRTATILLRETGSLLESRRKDLAAKREEIKALSALSARLPEIQTAALRADDLSVQASTLMDAGTTAKLGWAKKQIEKGRQIKEHEDRLAEILKSIDGEAETNLKTTQEGLKADEAALTTVNQQIDVQRQTLAGIQAELAALREVEAEIGKAEAEKGRLTGETAEWTYIRNACSKTGLQALEIDGVCPNIQYEANKLLSQTFGPTFSIRIQTQDEEGKEVFWIWVIDENGDEALLEDKCGGEKVWLLKALRLSLTMLSKSKSGLNFQGAFADEEDGALSVKNAMIFVDLYRSLMNTANFESVFFITHKPECLALADHIINFKKGGVEIR